MPSPFEHDEQDAARSDERAIEILRQKVDEEIPPIRKPLPPGDVDVNLEADDDDETRQEKKRNRYREAQEERDREREARIRLEAELAAMKAMQSFQPQHQRDELQEEIDKTYEKRRELFETFQAKQAAGELPKDEADKFLKRSRELEERSQELVYQRTARRNAPNANSQMQTAIMARHPDVVGDHKAFALADAEYRRLQALGEPATMETVDKATDAVRRELKLGKYRDEDPSRVRHAGPPKGSSGGSGPRPSKITMTPEMRRMADAAFPTIKDETKRYQHWANTAGKGFIEREREEGR